ncbi:MAG: DNA-directed RNA polymerase subunit beta [bacterium]|nr:DNA-directed RNA polymerase subunit beta [bacterium]
MELPNLIELQRSSYKRFIDEGMQEAFDDISPIQDFTGSLVLEFLGYELAEPKYSVEECRERDATYARPLMVKVRLIKKTNGQIVEAPETEVFMGDFPTMTDWGTFVINGAERVIVSQLVRSPGIYFEHKVDPATAQSLWNAVVIPNRGAWLELETDTSNTIYVRIDKGRKLPVTVLIRALGYGSDDAIRELFANDDMIAPTIEKDAIGKNSENSDEKNVEEALAEIYKKIRPGDPATPENARQLLENLFFESKRYDLAKVGSYRLARKLGRSIYCSSCGAVQEPGRFECSECGGRLEYSSTLSREDIIAAVRYMLALMKADAYRKSNDKSILENGLQMYVDREELYLKAADGDSFDIPVRADDIDHLGNRRIRGVGELLQNQFRVGLLRLERVVRERMSVGDPDALTPQVLINIRPVVAAIKEFFGSSQLSQFMDQTNMLAELTHKRRLSALGPGGLSRERAGFEVRDVHYSHYGRICPIETPEGPNIGLIGSLATYGKANQFGFIETPYRKVHRFLQADVKDPISGRLYKKGEEIGRKERMAMIMEGADVPVTVHVSDEVEYQSADVEDNYVIAQANTNLDEKNNIIDERVVVREKNKTINVTPGEIDYMDVTPKQIVSVATALIPFLEHDDANRALMGANMQRQAVPLLSPQAPIVGTGMEYRAAKDSGALIVSEHYGYVSAVSSDCVEVTRTDEAGKVITEETVKLTSDGLNAHGRDGRLVYVPKPVVDVYHLRKFKRSNAGTCINQRPAVKKGQKIKPGDILADGASSVNGELGLGRNVLVAFMPWEGYNYEDAILLSEEMVREDVFTSIHIEEYECEARDTKLGPEEITSDIPTIGEEARKNLDKDGIIRIGAEVRTEDILVGKVTPKGETELTAEERLLRAIFGEKSRDVRDTSLKVPHGEKGKVIDVKIFDRDTTAELKPGVNKLVRVYVAQKRKILQGDKMAGRHGNKGVVSRVMPIEDMPFLPDGTPVQIVLNPLGVPSRMNIGQILETHLGLAMKMLSEPGKPVFRVEVPVFDSAKESEIKDLMSMAKLQVSLRQKGFYLNTDELDYVLDDLPVATRLKNLINSFGSVVCTTREVEELLSSTPENKIADRVKKLLPGKKINDKQLRAALAHMTLRDRLAEVLSKHQRSYSDEEISALADYIIAYREHMPADGKTIIFDGRTGEPYDTRVTVGQIYMLKLAHLVDDKIHARSTGPYSLITQQPLGGKAQFGGQRFGEMEVWALEAYGAAYTLQELLTVKSDDVLGRVKTYEAIVKGENVLEPGVPESFKVLIKELQSLALDIKILDENNEEIEIRSVEDQEPAKKAGAGLMDFSDSTAL